MSFPKILKSKSNFNQIVLAYDEKNAFHLEGEFKTETSKNYNTHNTFDYGKEYLSNTYGEVVSPEHAEFIIELAKNTGFMFGSTKPDLHSVKSFMIYEDSFDVYSCDASMLSNECSRKQITIPLPPKSDKQELSGWPQVGDKVIATHPKNVLKGKLLALTRQYAIISQGAGEQHVHLLNWKITKAKTPEEELRDELMEMATTAMSDKNFDLDHNCYYLVSGLMHKYKIEPRE